jgi:predicted nucleic acid-binding protein
MTGTKPFFDTYVLLYLLSGDASKADRAEALIVVGGVISVQVLNEFASVGSGKLGMSWAEIREILKSIRAVCRVEPISVETHDRGLALSENYGFSIYDSMILASALLAGCKVVFTEDLQDGQCIDGRLTVRNPFAASLGRAALGNRGLSEGKVSYSK